MFDHLAIAWAIYRAGTPENLRELTEYGNAGPIADAVVAALTDAMHKAGVSNRPLNADALAAPTPTIPAGMVAVPVEPTREMWAAGGDAVVGYKQRHHDKVVAQIWSAMLAAAPKQAEQQGMERLAYRAAYAPLRSAQHALTIIARMIDNQRPGAAGDLARQESERIDAVLAALNAPTGAVEKGEAK